jgi:hypothetical protein
VVKRSTRTGEPASSRRDAEIWHANERMSDSKFNESHFSIFRVDEIFLSDAGKQVQEANALPAARNHVQTLWMLGSEAVLVDQIFLDVCRHVLINTDRAKGINYTIELRPRVVPASELRDPSIDQVGDLLRKESSLLLSQRGLHVLAETRIPAALCDAIVNILVAIV